MIALQILLTLFGLVGVFISIVGLPGIILVYVSAVIIGIATGFSEVSISTLIITGIISLLTLWIDNIAVLLGAKKFGASSKGLVGATVGAFLGFLMLPGIGMVIGAFLGAIIVEFAMNPDFGKSLRAGIGTFVGYLVGTFLKFVVTAILFVWMLTVIW